MLEGGGQRAGSEYETNETLIELEIQPYSGNNREQLCFDRSFDMLKSGVRN